MLYNTWKLLLFSYRISTWASCSNALKIGRHWGHEVHCGFWTLWAAKVKVVYHCSYVDRPSFVRELNICFFWIPPPDIVLETSVEAILLSDRKDVFVTDLKKETCLGRVPRKQSKHEVCAQNSRTVEKWGCAHLEDTSIHGCAHLHGVCIYKTLFIVVWCVIEWCARVDDGAWGFLLSSLKSPEL